MSRIKEILRRGLSSIASFFESVAHYAKGIVGADNHPEKFATPPPAAALESLPDELLQHILGFSQTSAVTRVALVNKRGNDHAQRAEIQQAQEYGYKGKDFVEAKNYLNILFQGIDTLVKDDHIPKKYVVHRDRGPFFRYLDSEATFRNIKHLNPDKATILKAHFSEVLLVCTKKEQVEAVNVLLKLGANPNIRNNSGETPLHLAMSKHNKELVTLLLSHGADPNLADNNGFTPLCCNTSSHEITDLLATKGANVDHQTNQNGYYALHFAAKNGQVETLRVLLKHGANPNIRNNSGETPLHLAMSKHNKELVTLLLSHGADPNLADNNGFTPLCCNTSSHEITDLLATKGANVDHQTNQNGYYALHFAAKNGQVETLRVLLKHGANPNIRNNSGETPLHLAMSKHNKELVTLLLSHGADPNLADNNGFTPLCCNTSSHEITDLLATKGANVDHQTNQNGYYALHFAAKNGQVETLRVLLKHGANPNIRNNSGETPLHLAMSKHNKELVTLLLSHGADPNLANNNGFTPLCWNTGSHEITDLLATKGANVDHQTNQNGYYALHFAAKNGQVETLRVLLKHGANPSLVNAQGQTPLQVSQHKSIKTILGLYEGN